MTQSKINVIQTESQYRPALSTSDIFSHLNGSVYDTLWISLEGGKGQLHMPISEELKKHISDRCVLSVSGENVYLKIFKDNAGTILLSYSYQHLIGGRCLFELSELEYSKFLSLSGVTSSVATGSSKKAFSIPDSGKTDKNIEDLDFYAWLDDQPGLVHNNITTVKEYLSFLGFNGDKHKALSGDLQMMRYTIDQHFRDGLKKDKGGVGLAAIQGLKFTTRYDVHAIDVTSVSATDYKAVKVVLENIGGKWSRTANAFVFPDDRSELLERVKNGEKINLEREFKKRTNFFATPTTLADKMAADMLSHFDHTNGIKLLEPSAGKLSLVNACIKTRLVFPNQFDVCEYEKEFRDQMKNKGVNIVATDFLEYNKDGKIKYDAIIANPPFSNDRDYSHLLHMISMLAPGGILKAIIGSNMRDKMKILLKSYNAVIINIPAGEFRESGTNVSTAEITIKL